MAQAAFVWRFLDSVPQQFPYTFRPITPCSTARNDVGAIQHRCHPVSSEMTILRPATLVISTAAKQSGEIPRSNGARPIVTGDFSTQCLNSPPYAFRPITPCSTARNDGGAIQRRCHPVSSEMTILRPASIVISTAAKQSGEIPRSNGTSRFCLEISRLRASAVPLRIPPPTAIEACSR